MKLQADEYSTEEILKILREWTGLTQKEFRKIINRMNMVFKPWKLDIDT